MNSHLYKGVMKMVLFITATILLCRTTDGYFGLILWGAAFAMAVQGKNGLAISCFAFFPFMVVLNPFLLPKGPLFGHVLRFGPLSLGMVLAVLSSRRHGCSRLPLGSLFIYLACAVVSSAGGWCAPISYMKLINFVFFIIGIWLGAQNLQDRPADILTLRYFFLGLASFVVFGSLLTLPFPAIAYPLDMNMAAVMKDFGVQAANEYYRDTVTSQTLSLFAGVTMHSQTLGPLCSCFFALVLADMLFIEKRSTPLHLVLLVALLGMLFMTRSRTALLSTTVGVFMVMFYAAKRMPTSMALKRKIKGMVLAGAIAILLSAIVAEISSQAMTRWIRKTNDQGEFNRSLTDAVTNTRMGLFEEAMYEFRKNPLLGMGFQVNSATPMYYRQSTGLVLSAPVEKGLLPMMVLGEGGVVGAVAFIIFLIAFYRSCATRRLVISASMFTVFLAANIGEATFFSPGGAGGVEWVLCGVGGFVVDTMFLCQRRMDRDALSFRSW